MILTDYLAKTAGQAFVVCNEPDGSSELLLTDRLKQLVSDSDKLSVRRMFGEQEDMSIFGQFVFFFCFLFSLCSTMGPFVVFDRIAQNARLRTKQCSFATPHLVCRR